MSLKHVSRENAIKIAASLEMIEETLAEKGDSNDLLEVYTSLRRPSLAEMTDPKNLNVLERWVSEEVGERIVRGKARKYISDFYHHNIEGDIGIFGLESEKFHVLNFNDLELTIFRGEINNRRINKLRMVSTEYWNEDTKGLLNRDINPEVIVLTKYGEIEESEMLSNLKKHLRFD